MSKTPGQAAYEAWCEAGGFATMLVPSWEQLHKDSQQLWGKIAQAAVEADRTPVIQPTEPAVVLSFKMPFGATVMRKQEDPAVWHDITGASAVSITRIDAPVLGTFLRQRIIELLDEPGIHPAAYHVLAELLKEDTQ